MFNCGHKMKGLQYFTTPGRSMTPYVFLTFTALAAVFTSVSAAPSIGDKLNDAAKNLDKKFDNLCVMNDNCNTFWTLKNYCCKVQCCDVISYITRDE